MIDDIFAINLYHFPFIPAFVYNEVIDKGGKRVKRNRYNESFDPLLGGKTSYYVLGIVILLALIIYFSIRSRLYSSLSESLSLLSCPIIVCTDLVLSFGTSHQTFEQAPFEELVSHYRLCDYFIFIGAWKHMAYSFS